MATKSPTMKTKKARLAALNMDLARTLLEFVGPSLIKLASDKRHWELIRKLVLKISASQTKE